METTTMNANDVKKELYKTKVNAKFSHFDEKKMFYTVELESGKYIFPIPTVVKRTITIMDGEDVLATIETEKAAPDLNGASFSNEIKASELNRWIVKAIEKDEFIKVA
jgi:hypothetical protein